jgi:hypothetical protein
MAGRCGFGGALRGQHLPGPGCPPGAKPSSFPIHHCAIARVFFASLRLPSRGQTFVFPHPPLRDRAGFVRAGNAPATSPTRRVRPGGVGCALHGRTRPSPIWNEGFAPKAHSARQRPPENPLAGTPRRRRPTPAAKPPHSSRPSPAAMPHPPTRTPDPPPPNLWIRSNPHPTSPAGRTPTRSPA